jgi:hypothetical protein
VKLLANPEKTRRDGLQQRSKGIPVFEFWTPQSTWRRSVFTTLVASLRLDRFQAAGVASSLEDESAAALVLALPPVGCRSCVFLLMKNLRFGAE